MALNKFMHERNPFKNKRPDFKALALKYDKFRQVAGTDLRGAVTLDFKRPECLQALTWALLKEHFGLDVDLPLDRLIPTVPLRLNYILWLEDLVERREHGVYGIDIGAGASCIYALLGAQKNHWHFLTTEADEMNYNFAKHNVQRNGLLDKIQVMKVAPKELLEAAVAASEPERCFDFCMCNPPFFASNLEAWGMNSRSDDRPDPKSQSTACDSESVFPGGEVQFVRHLIADSLVLRDRVRIYTTMLGKKTSVNILKEDLRKNKVPHMATTEFCQGRTMRWGLAWSFDATVTFPKSYKNQLKSNKPQVYNVPPTLTNCPDVPYSIQGVAQKVQHILDDLQMTYTRKMQLSSKWMFEATAHRNTWSHQRRRRRQEKRRSSETHSAAEGKVKDSAIGGKVTHSATEGKVTHSATEGKVTAEKVLLSEAHSASESKVTAEPIHSKTSGMGERHAIHAEPTAVETLGAAVSKTATSEKDLSTCAEPVSRSDVTSQAMESAITEQSLTSSDNGFNGTMEKQYLSHQSGDTCSENEPNRLKVEDGNFPTDKTRKRSLDHGAEDSCSGNESKRLKTDDNKNDSQSATPVPVNQTPSTNSESENQPATDSNVSMCESSNPPKVIEKTTQVNKHNMDADKCEKDENKEKGNSSGSEQQECLVCCQISVYKEVAGVVVQLHWVRGSAKDAMQQVMQHIRNTLK